MYIFDLNRRYNWHYNCPYNQLILALIHIKFVHSSISYQWAINQKFDWRVCKSPSGYGPLALLLSGLVSIQTKLSRGVAFGSRKSYLLWPTD